MYGKIKNPATYYARMRTKGNSSFLLKIRGKKSDNGLWSEMEKIGKKNNCSLESIIPAKIHKLTIENYRKCKPISTNHILQMLGGY